MMKNIFNLQFRIVNTFQFLLRILTINKYKQKSYNLLFSYLWKRLNSIQYVKKIINTDNSFKFNFRCLVIVNILQKLQVQDFCLSCLQESSLSPETILIHFGNNSNYNSYSHQYDENSLTPDICQYSPMIYLTTLTLF